VPGGDKIITRRIGIQISAKLIEHHQHTEDGMLFKLKRKNAERDTWKEKAKRRRSEAKALQKYTTELKVSRDQWKKKAKALQQQNRDLREELKKNSHCAMEAAPGATDTPVW
jgi:hypothetical protein